MKDQAKSQYEGRKDTITEVHPVDLDSHVGKVNLDPCHIPYITINVRWAQT